MSENQGQKFLDGEGDAWFLRNSQSLKITPAHPSIDFISLSLSPFRDEISTILEIGCGGGAKLSALSRIFAAKGCGIDPSKKAIEFARKEYRSSESDLSFVTGLATDLPYENEKFDFLYFGFCLYLLAPNEILKAVAEADRVLKTGGFLAIYDFDYGQLKINPYKHADGVFSYKNNYSKLFTSSGYYHQISKWSFSLSRNVFVPDKDERISIEVLYKELN